MNDILINPQTGDVVKLTNGQWAPVDKSQVMKNPETGEVAVLDGGAWKIAGRVGPVAQPKSPEQEQADYLNKDTLAPRMQLDIGPTTDTLSAPNPSIANTIARTGQEYVDKALLGGGDELGAAARMLASGPSSTQTLGEQFNAEFERLRGQRQQFAAESPTISTVAATAGVLGSPANLVGGEYVAAGRTAPWRIARASGTGGAVGGTAGALSTDGGIEDRLLGGAIGAGLGATAGAVAQPGMELLGFGAKKGGEAGAAIYNTIKNQVQARANPQGQAEKLIAQTFANDQIPLGYGPAPINAPLPGQGLINLGGENVTALGRQATVAPGPGRTAAHNFFEEQAAGQSDRAADALGGLSNQGYYGTLETLDATRRAAATPNYEAWYATPSVDHWTPRISELMRRPSMRAAYQRAQTIAQEEGRNPTELGLDFNAAGDPSFLAGADANGQVPSSQTMDYIKRGLDDVMQAQPRDPATGRIVLDEATRAIDGTRREFVGIIRENPAAAAALDSWAGPSHSIEVMDLGRQIFRHTGDPADSIRRFQQLSPADQDYARIGYMRDAINAAGNVTDGGSVYNRLHGTSNKRALAEVMFPDRQSFDQYAQQMLAERKMTADNRAIMQGSRTTPMQAENAAFEDASNAINFIGDLKSMNPLRILASALDREGNLRRGVTPEVANALAERLFTSDPVQIQRVLSQVGARQPAIPPAVLAEGLLRRSPAVPLVGQGAGFVGSQLVPVN